MKDVLVRAARETVAHKLAENVPDHHDYCFWEVSGTPRQTGDGASIMFSDGECIHATATIVGVVEGEIRFDPLERVDEEQPTEPPTRGFVYVD